MLFQKNNKFGRLGKGHKHPKKLIFRPDNPCPKCKSINVISAGENWRCGKCKRTWVKTPKDRKSQKVYRFDIQCPKCGSHQIKSMGERWHCGDCGKEWQKQYKKKEDYNFVRKLVIPIDEFKKLYYNEKMSQSQIAKKYSVSQGTILNFMRKHGLQARPKHMVLPNHFNSENLKSGYEKVSMALKGNTNWRFSHKYPNSEEEKLIRFFNKWNFPFKYVGNGSFKINGKCPDFINEEKKLIIEFFGELWHKDSDELKRIEFFKQCEWKTLVIWGKELWQAKGKDRNYPKEKQLYDKILKWMAGI